MDDYWVVKLDGSGNLQWQKCLGGTVGEEAWSAQQTADGGYIFAGRSESNNGDVTGNHGINDYWVVKLDGSGNLQWQKCLGGTNTDDAHSVQQTADGGYMVAGRTWSNDGDVTGNHDTTGQYSDYWLVKLDSSGNLQWQKCLGGTYNDQAYSVQQTADGGYMVAGSTDSNDGDVTGNHGGADYWVVKLFPYVLGIEEETNNSFVNLFPNPATNELTIENGKLRIEKIELYNAVGEVVLNYQLSTINYQLSVDVSQLLPGVYFVAVTDDKGNKITRRFIKM
jgi:hypothetical protein